MNEWVWSNGGMILTGENWSTVRKTLYSVGGRWMNEYGAVVEWYWQGKTEVLGEKHYTAWVVDEWMSMEQWWNDTAVLGEKPVTVSLFPPQIPHGLALDWTHACTVTGWRLTAWLMAWPDTMWSGHSIISHMTIIFTQTSVTEIQLYTIKLHYVRKTTQWMIYMEIMVVLCKNRTECISTLCDEKKQSF